MKILVDADACPVKEIIVKLAKKKAIPVTMLLDTSHLYSDGYSRVIIVDKGMDSADIRLANLICVGDVVVTQDYGVAAMALGKGAAVINQNGWEYNNSNMDQLLFERYLGRKIRRSGGRVGKIRARSMRDNVSFASAFDRLLDRLMAKDICHNPI